MRLSEIRAETKSLVVPFGAGDLKVVYRPNAYTADVADQMATTLQEAQRPDGNPRQATSAFIEMVTGLLVSWDLEDDGGEVIPIDVDRLRAEVPMPVFGRIFTELQKDMNPGEAARR